MDWHTILRFIHITSFAAWFGTVFTSLFVLKTLEPKLTGSATDTATYPEFLKSFIKRETKVADAGLKSQLPQACFLLSFFMAGPSAYWSNQDLSFFRSY